jgi:CRISPR-associated endonuclease/helicase Cas3
MNQIWAKSSGISLRSHVKDLLSVLDELDKKLNNRPFWNKIKNVLYYAIICHDLGKVQPAFQIKSLKNKGYQPFDLSHEIPHSLASLLFISQDIIKEKIEQSFIPFFFSAVAFHHFRENFNDFLSNDNGRVVRFCQILLEDVKWREELINNLKSELEEYQEFIAFNQTLTEGLHNGLAISNYVVPPYLLEWIPKRLETSIEKENFYIYLSGFLQRCDHFASFCENEGIKEPVEIDNIDRVIIWERIIQSIREKAKTNDIWQEKILEDNPNQNLILIAPTGYGKTEFAFLWSNGEKFFYTLPLRTAVNQIFDRGKKIWEEKIGLLHSYADLVFLKKDEETAQRMYDLSRQISFPVNISTGDQFFPYALRPIGYERIYATFSYSRLAIDEVQAYNPKSAAIVVKFTQDMARLGGKYLLMTATLPSFIKHEITERTDLGKDKIFNIYEQEKEKLEKIQKHLIERISVDDYSSIAERVIQEAEKDNGRRVLVILNTIKKAQIIYTQICESINKDKHSTLLNKTWLLHSRFTMKDRQEKEKFIETEFKNPKVISDGPNILVATQVIEASLDLDADVLFTELAPLDALIQRMGRVLRRIGPSCKNIKDGIYQAAHGGEYQVDLKNPNVYLIDWALNKESNDNDKDKEKTKTLYPEDLLKATAWIFNQLFNGQKAQNIQVDNLKNFLTQPVTKKQKKMENETITLENGKVLLSEYEKYLLVNLLYQGIEVANSNYIKNFYDTLAILDAGYMSSRKSEAQRMFREIANISVIAQNCLDDFSQDIVRFLQLEDPSYSKFKWEILSKYLISIPFYKVKMNNEEIYIRLLNSLNQENRQRLRENKKMKNWLLGIFIANGCYDSQIGYKNVKEKEGKGIKENNNII